MHKYRKRSFIAPNGECLEFSDIMLCYVIISVALPGQGIYISMILCDDTVLLSNEAKHIHATTALDISLTIVVYMNRLMTVAV